MKKLIVILLIAVYGSSAIGWAINNHYCGGYLAKVSFLNFEAKKVCTCNPKEIPKNCCKDELQYEKTEDHKIVQQVSLFDLAPFSLEPPAAKNYHLSPVQDVNGTDFIKNNVLRRCLQPVYLLNQVFRI